MCTIMLSFMMLCPNYAKPHDDMRHDDVLQDDVLKRIKNTQKECNRAEFFFEFILIFGNKVLLERT